MILRSEQQLIENEQAIYWLYKKGFTPRDIRFVKWKNVIPSERKYKIYEHDEKTGNEKMKKLSYANSPLETVINRGQEGKEYFILSRCHPKSLVCGFQPVGFLYTEYQIESIIRAKIAEKPLTLWSRFGRIEVSKVNITK